MDDFLSQFLARVWPLILFLIGMIVAYISLFIYLRRRRIRIQAEKKAGVMGEAPAVKEKREKPKPEKQKAVSTVPERLSTPLADLDDGDDPLAELYAVRAEEAKQELAMPRPALQKTPPPAPKAAPKVEEEEVVDLASLLAGMAEDAKEYHQISPLPVLVNREDAAKTSAKELLSIQRDESDKRLLVQIGEIGYRSLLNNASAKSSFTQTMKELAGVILADDTLPPAPENPGGEAHRIAKELLNLRLDNGREATSRELFSILRDEADGHLMIQIGDIAYRSLKQNEQAKTAFTKIMKELSTVVLQPDSRPAPDIVEQVEQYEDSPSSTEVLELTDQLPPGVIRFKKMDELGPTHTVGRFGQVKVSKEKIEVPEVNIAEAIETYLQYKISQNASFQNRGIHVRPTPGGGVRIEAEGKGYEYVDDVANLEIRAFIKQAIAEWQDHH